ncbi:unnamed protein product [Adineta ricciae]|uniref:RZ-type domain-containing protein n=1 Tax=Adineta ricciae TaxID=249248 RepID=A0A814UWG2_ADIRI|nr:unnamed protein product [Adineta ricciae]CAF1180996.1 unnamed protein product [Adineta ricciae]
MYGESCPQKCRICDRDFVQEIFFVYEGEPDARFVFLPDCKHIIQVTALDQSINKFVNESNDKTAIRFPVCPRCSRRIYRCTRYTPVFNKVYGLISQDKKKILGDKSKEEMNQCRQELLIEYETMKMSSKEIVLHPTNKDFFSILTSKDHFFSNDKLNLFTNIIGFLIDIDKTAAEGFKKLPKDVFKRRVISSLSLVKNYLFTQRCGRNFAEQQLNDIDSELKRIRRVIYIESFICSIKRSLEAHEKDGLDCMQNLTSKVGPFTDDDQAKFNVLVEKFQYLNNLPGLRINEDERKSICGGANEVSDCPDCGERIGGQDHNLLETNRHSSLMDSLQYAAWSNEANLRQPPALH